MREPYYMSYTPGMTNQPAYRNRTRPAPPLMKADTIGVAALAAVAGIAWIVLAPLRIWHTTGADGQPHPDTATWIAYGTGGAVIMAALMFFSIRAAGNRTGGSR